MLSSFSGHRLRSLSQAILPSFFQKFEEVLSDFRCTHHVDSLRLHLDSELTMNDEAPCGQSCRYLSLPSPTLPPDPTTRGGVDQEVTTRLMLAIVISRLDYCNARAALAGLPQACNCCIATCPELIGWLDLQVRQS